MITRLPSLCYSLYTTNKQITHNLTSEIEPIKELNEWWQMNWGYCPEEDCQIFCVSEPPGLFLQTLGLIRNWRNYNKSGWHILWSEITGHWGHLMSSNLMENEGIVRKFYIMHWSSQETFIVSQWRAIMLILLVL